MTFQSTQGSASDVPAEGRPLAVTKLAELQELFAQHRNVRFICAERLAECDRDPVRKCLRQFRKEASALERKDRAPKLIEPDRDNRRFCFPRDDFVTTPQSQQRSDAGQFALRKQADDFPGANSGDRLAHSVLCLASGDRDATDGAQEWIQDRVSVNACIDDETNGPRAGEGKNDRVDPGDVIWQEKESTLRQRVSAGGRDAIKQSRERQAEESKQTFRAGEVRHVYGLQGRGSSVQLLIR